MPRKPKPVPQAPPEPSATLLSDLVLMIASARQRAAVAVNVEMTSLHWQIGRRIVEEEQQGENRAAYGKAVLKILSQGLTEMFGKGFSVQNLYLMRKFYLEYPQAGQQKFQTEFGKLGAETTSPFALSWSHYLVLMGIKNPDERRFYEIEAEANNWKLRELERQIDAALYERLALTQDQGKVRELAKQGQRLTSPKDAIKDPYILEFLGLEIRPSYSENELESAIIDKLEHFLLELGKGFLFEARQKRFSFDEEHFCVDLVFYNRLLRCYVLIDLKIGKLTHQDLGQMQMYVNYFDRYVKLGDENPTIGIVLCKRKKDSLIELTLPKDANIFASQYQLYLPSKEELQQQIEAAVEASAESSKMP